MPYKKLWIAFGVIMLVSFAVLGGVGYKAINNGPPIPAKVVTADGRLLFTGETIRDGQNVWQSTGGQEIGTIWGHGAYLGPDFSADYLHTLALDTEKTVAERHGFVMQTALPPSQRLIRPKNPKATPPGSSARKPSATMATPPSSFTCAKSARSNCSPRRKRSSSPPRSRKATRKPANR